MSNTTIKFTYTVPIQEQREERREDALPRKDALLHPDTMYLSVLTSLDELVGMTKVKESLTEMAHYSAIQQLRKKYGLPVPNMAYHMALLGNPGTGKTTVARVIAKLFHALGVTKRDSVTEVSRVDLVGSFVGHTAKDTTAILKQALGGVLFIDEAYSLAKADPRDFGNEAVETILKFMEDHRNEIVVLFAGYPVQMEYFLLSNPGLSSRVPHQLSFDDFTVDELIAIADVMTERVGYRISDDARRELFNLFLMERDNPLFANARFVRNVVEKMMMRQSARLARKHMGFTREELNWLTRYDIPADRNGAITRDG